METRKPQLLLHPLFIFSLIILLVNDSYWKYEYHNWLTGKLSDFAGLFVLSVFLSAFFYKHRPFLYFAIAVFFIGWKTPLSQPLIDLLNQTFSLKLSRTIDYSDYIAIPVVLAAHFLKPVQIHFSLPKKLAVYFIFVVCLFAFSSTTCLRKFYIEPDLSKRIQYRKDYPTRLSHAAILHRLDSMQLNYKIDSFTMAPLNFYGGSFLIRKRDSLDNNWMIIDPKQQEDTLVYFRINEHPYIAIYNFNAGEETFPQINISVYNDAKETTIRLETIFLTDYQMEEHRYKVSKTQNRFRRLVEKTLIRKLK